MGLPAVAMSAEGVKPNILWVITDDHRADALACWNRATTGKSESALGYVSSPNIDKLAEEGVLFANAFCNSPVSAPSRASMHTGRYPHHSGIYDFCLSHLENDNSKPVLPAVMREQGYKATLFGKLGVRIFPHNEPMRFMSHPDIYNECISMEGDLERVGITDWCKKSIYQKGLEPGDVEQWFYPDGSMVQYYFKRKNGELTKEDIATIKKFNEDQQVIRIGGRQTGEIISGVSTMPTKKTLDGRIQEEFMSYLSNEDKKYKILRGRTVDGPKRDQPQFINLGFHFPHTAVMPSKEYRDQFLKYNYNIPVFDAEEEMNMPKQFAGWRKQNDITVLSNKDKEQFIRDYYAFCAMGDHLLGEAVEKFKSYCADRNEPYLIVLTCGDHGWHLGEQGVTCKASNYVKSNQTAVIVVSSDKKAFPAGKVVKDLVEYVDFAPTFMEAAGVDITSERFNYLDGRSLKSTASGKTTPRDYVLGETSVSGGHRCYLRGDDFAFSMRSKKPFLWKDRNKVGLNEEPEWILNCTPEEADMALFDLRVDKGENNNVAYDKKYAALADFFRKKLGNIALGDNRIECNWNKINDYKISSFGVGSDDKKLDIPSNIIPDVSGGKKKKKK